MLYYEILKEIDKDHKAGYDFVKLLEKCNKEYPWMEPNEICNHISLAVNKYTTKRYFLRDYDDNNIYNWGVVKIINLKSDGTVYIRPMSSIQTEFSHIDKLLPYYSHDDILDPYETFVVMKTLHETGNELKIVDIAIKFTSCHISLIEDFNEILTNGESLRYFELLDRVKNDYPEFGLTPKKIENILPNGQCAMKNYQHGQPMLSELKPVT